MLCHAKLEVLAVHSLFPPPTPAYTYAYSVLNNLLSHDEQTGQVSPAANVETRTEKWQLQLLLTEAEGNNEI